MNTIETAFSSIIWQKGHEYFLKERVKNVEVYGDCVRARVKGTRTYDVVIHYKRATVTKMYCDCAYAEGENKCKHMAALLLKMEMLGMINTHTRLIEKEDSQSLNEWQQIVKHYTGKDNLLNMLQTSKLQQSFVTLLMKDIKRLNKNNSDDILQHISLMVTALNDVEEEVSIFDIINTLPRLFQVMNNLSQQMKVRKWAREKSLETHRNDMFELFIQHSFSQNQQGLSELETYIQTAYKNKKNDVVLTCLELQIKIMRYLKYTEEDIVASLDEYCDYIFVVEYKIEYYMQNKAYEQAKNLLAKYAKEIKLDDEKSAKINEFLVEIALAEKAYEDCYIYIEEELRISNYNYPITVSERIRDSFDSKREWKDFLWGHTQALKNKVPYYRLLNYFQLIGEYDCFYNLILERFDIDNLLENMEELIDYDEELFQLVFYVLIKQEMQEASKASQYEKIVFYLRTFKMHLVKENAFTEIIIYAKEQYAKKSLFMKYLKELY